MFFTKQLSKVFDACLSFSFRSVSFFVLVILFAIYALLKYVYTAIIVRLTQRVPVHAGIDELQDFLNDIHQTLERPQNTFRPKIIGYNIGQVQLYVQ